MYIYYAPEITPHKTLTSVFLAGSIEMDTAARWQDTVSDALAHEDCEIYNPRRFQRDNSWKQSIDDKNFNEQVNREIDHLEKADIILMYFDTHTKSPITLLELGLFAEQAKEKKKEMIVCCGEGFRRKGNVDIVCKRYDIQQANSLDEAIQVIKNILAAKK